MADCGRMWQNGAEWGFFGRMWQNFAECGIMWQNVVLCGRNLQNVAVYSVLIKSSFPRISSLL